MLQYHTLSPFFLPFIQQEEKKANGFFQDLHIHTVASDSSIQVEQIATFLRDKKYIISITDHNEISGNLALANLGIKVIPGLELGCEDGFELLVYFQKQEEMIHFYENEVKDYKNPFRMAKTNRSIFEYLSVLKNYSCHLSIPHIAGFMQKNFLENKSYIYDLLAKVDSLEVHNHTLSTGKNNKALSLQREFQTFSTFGSDAHSMKELKIFYRFCNHIETQFSKFLNPFWKAGSLAGIGEKHLLHFVMNYKSIIS